jgi:hypothetical protein
MTTPRRGEPQSAADYHQRGLERLRKGALPGAVADLSRAIELAPHDLAGADVFR